MNRPSWRRTHAPKPRRHGDRRERSALRAFVRRQTRRPALLADLDDLARDYAERRAEREGFC